MGRLWSDLGPIKNKAIRKSTKEKTNRDKQLHTMPTVWVVFPTVEFSSQQPSIVWAWVLGLTLLLLSSALGCFFKWVNWQTQQHWRYSDDDTKGCDIMALMDTGNIPLHTSHIYFTFILQITLSIFAKIGLQHLFLICSNMSIFWSLSYFHRLWWTLPFFCALPIA